MTKSFFALISFLNEVFYNDMQTQMHILLPFTKAFSAIRGQEAQKYSTGGGGLPLMSVDFQVWHFFCPISLDFF